MFISKKKFINICYKTIEETARSCGRNLSERQKNEIYLKLWKRSKNGKNKK